MPMIPDSKAPGHCLPSLSFPTHCPLRLMGLMEPVNLTQFPPIVKLDRASGPGTIVISTFFRLSRRQGQLPQGLQCGQDVLKADLLPVRKPMVDDRQLEAIEGIA